MKSRDVRPRVSGFFHHTFSQVIDAAASLSYPFLSLADKISLYGYNTFRLRFPRLTDIGLLPLFDCDGSAP